MLAMKPHNALRNRAPTREARREPRVSKMVLHADAREFVSFGFVAKFKGLLTLQSSI